MNYPHASKFEKSPRQHDILKEIYYKFVLAVSKNWEPLRPFRISTQYFLSLDHRIKRLDMRIMNR